MSGSVLTATQAAILREMVSRGRVAQGFRAQQILCRLAFRGLVQITNGSARITEAGRLALASYRAGGQ